MSVDLEKIRRYFELDRFATDNGVRLEELRPGFAKAMLAVEEKHLNSVGIIQGGAIFTLADLAFAAAMNAVGKTAVTITANLSLVKAVRTGTLYAEAREISRSRRIATGSVQVTNEAAEIIATLQGTAYIKDEPFPPSDGPGEAR